MHRSSLQCGLLLAVAAALPVNLQAQEGGEQPSLEARAKMQRQGAGLRVGYWALQGLEEIADDSRSPFFEGYFQRGLDLHLAIESSAAVWRRHTEEDIAGGPLGGGGTQVTNAYVVPLFTGVRFFPFTRPGSSLEPYVSAGVGFALGIEDVDAPEGLVPGGGGTSVATGFGFKAGAGVEWRLASALAVDVAGRYHWIRFGQELSGDDTYKGPGLDIGLSYRFQYE